MRKSKAQQGFDFGGPDPSGQEALFGTTTKRADQRISRRSPMSPAERSTVAGIRQSRGLLASAERMAVNGCRPADLVADTLLRGQYQWRDVCGAESEEGRRVGGARFARACDRLRDRVGLARRRVEAACMNASWDD